MNFANRYSVAATFALFLFSMSTLSFAEDPTTPPTTSTTAASDPCIIFPDCQSCTKNNTKDKIFCGFELTADEGICLTKINPEETLRSWITDFSKCPAAPNTTTTSTTTPPPTTNSTTTTLAPSTTTNATTVAPTTTTQAPTTPSSNTTTTVGPTPQPHHDDHGSFNFGSFCGGAVTAVALSAIAYVGFRFYRARRDQNFHSLL